MFKPGDVVKLQSGTGWSIDYKRVGNIRALSLQSNPKMTVERTTPVLGVTHEVAYHIVHCAWFAGAELKRDSFFEATLVAA